MPQARGKTLSTCYMLPKALRAERGSRAERAPALALGGRSAVRQRGSGDEGGREGDQRREAQPRRHRVPRVTALARALVSCAVCGRCRWSQLSGRLRARTMLKGFKCVIWEGVATRPTVGAAVSKPKPELYAGLPAMSTLAPSRHDTPTEGRRRIRLWFRRRDSANCRVCGTSGRVDLAP